MDPLVTDPAEPRAEIERLEERIEELARRLENCRKFAFLARITIALGGLLLVALVLGVVGADPLPLIAAIAALLGGIVMLGSNRSTANEAAAQMRQAEAARAELIGRIGLRVVGGRDTVH